MFSDPYKTTIGSLINTQSVEKEIRDSLNTRKDFVKVNEKNLTIEIYPNGLISKFEHPLLLNLNNKLTYSVVDLSPFVRLNDNGEISVVNYPLYNFQRIRNALTADLINNGNRSIKSLPGRTSRTYNDLISNSLAAALNLSLEEVLIINTISAWFFHCNLMQNTNIGEIELESILASIERETNIPVSFTNRYIDGTIINNVNEFIETIKEKIDNPNIKKLNIGLFYTVISKNINSSIWVGLDKQQLLAVGIEHIPTFIALLYISLSEPVFRNVGLSKIASRNYKNDKSNFLIAVDTIANIK